MKQNKKGINLLVVIIVIILIIGAPILLFSMNKEESNENNNNNVENSSEVTSNVVVKVYNEGTDKVLNTINVNDGESVKKIQKINENLKASPSADVKLAVAREWEITIDEDILISGNLSEGYCYYYNKEENISKLVKRPEELNEWLDKIL